MNTDVPDAAFSVGEIEAFHFDITSVGRGPRNAKSAHTQSFYVVGRAFNSHGGTSNHDASKHV